MLKAPFAVFALGLLVGGCAEVLTARGKEAAWSGFSKTGLSVTASCLIKGMNAAMHYDNPLQRSLTHQAGIIDPDRVLEIAPQQVVTVGAEVYFVRLTAASKSSTSIELFGNYNWSEKLKPVMVACT